MGPGAALHILHPHIYIDGAGALGQVGHATRVVPACAHRAPAGRGCCAHRLVRPRERACRTQSDELGQPTCWQE